MIGGFEGEVEDKRVRIEALSPAEPWNGRLNDHIYRENTGSPFLTLILRLV